MGDIIPVVYNMVRKGSSAYFARDFGSVKMKLNLGFEFFCCSMLNFVLNYKL